MMRQATHHPLSEPQVADSKEAMSGEIVAGVLVCSGWPGFTSETAVSHFLTTILTQQWPHLPIAPQARIERIAGRRARQPQMRTNVRELPLRLCGNSENGMQVVQVYGVETAVTDPQSQVWCWIAVSTSPRKHKQSRIQA